MLENQSDGRSERCHEQLVIVCHFHSKSGPTFPGYARPLGWGVWTHGGLCNCKRQPGTRINDIAATARRCKIWLVAMRLQIIPLLVLFFLSNAAGGTKEIQEDSRRVGDLAVTLVGLEEPEDRVVSDHHAVTIRLRAENVGKRALCASFRSTLRTTFDLQYRGISPWSNRFHISELLPGETVQGEYDFSVKNGVEPLQFLLIPTSRTQACSGEHQTFLAVRELRFDLARLARPSPQDGISEGVEPIEAAKARIFLTGLKGAEPQPNAMKAFREHCPEAQMTTEKGKADYLVELVPTSLRRSKNAVIVTNRRDDVIYSGETLNLGNAAKDACAAILRDMGEQDH